MKDLVSKYLKLFLKIHINFHKVFKKKIKYYVKNNKKYKNLLTFKSIMINKN
jgi:hypothetical protein